MVNGYSQLRTRVERFLKDNPDVQQLTLKRPKPKNRKVYQNGNAECYGQMPETCPVVQAILQEMIPDGMVIKQGDISISAEDLRDAIFRRIHDQVTSKFRRVYEEVCDQKHILLSRLRAHRKSLNEWIEQAETEIPEAPEASEPSRSRGRARPNEVEFEVAEDEDSDYIS